MARNFRKMNELDKSGKRNLVMLKVGEAAPDFTLPSHQEGRITLSSYRDRKNVVLAFYPLDWTPV